MAFNAALSFNTDLVHKKHFLFILKTVVLLNIFVEILMRFFQDFLFL